MCSLKLPYYPQLHATTEKTLGGIQEISHPDVYNVPIQNKVIYRVDLLDCLRPIIGESCFIYRKFIYNTIAGHGDVSTLIGHLYRRHKHFYAYVNDVATYGDETVPLVDRCVNPLRERVAEYELEVLNKLTSCGAKYLVTTHGYLYVCFNIGNDIPEFLGGICIC